MDVKRYGSGSVQVLLVPGGPGLLPGFYEELVEGLAAFAQVRTYVQRGTTPPDSEEFPRSIKGFADELGGVAEEVSGDADATVVLGHSFGVPVLIEALLSGLSIDGAILSNGFDSTTMMRRGLGDRFSDLPKGFHEAYARIDRTNLAELMPVLAEHFYPKHFCRRDPWPESFLTGLGQINPKVLLHYLGTNLFDPDGVIRDWDRSADVASIRVPSLVISGAYDYFREEDNRRMAEALPSAELWLSETASHSPWIEDPQGFYAATGRFLARLGKVPD